MNSRSISIAGLGLLVLSQILLAFGYDFLMSQRPLDYAHWSLLIAALLLFSLWFSLPHNATKKIGLCLMTAGIAGIIGMCTIDFILWAAHENIVLKDEILSLIMSKPILELPFLVIGPSLFYGGMSIATYGLFRDYKAGVILLNIGALLIGLGFMALKSHLLPAAGSILLFIGFSMILLKSK